MQAVSAEPGTAPVDQSEAVDQVPLTALFHLSVQLGTAGGRPTRARARRDAGRGCAGAVRAALGLRAIRLTMTLWFAAEPPVAAAAGSVNERITKIAAKNGTVLRTEIT
jgi:hypothetical protein